MTRAIDTILAVLGITYVLLLVSTVVWISFNSKPESFAFPTDNILTVEPCYATIPASSNTDLFHAGRLFKYKPLLNSDKDRGSNKCFLYQDKTLDTPMCPSIMGKKGSLQQQDKNIKMHLGMRIDPRESICVYDLPLS